MTDMISRNYFALRRYSSMSDDGQSHGLKIQVFSAQTVPTYLIFMSFVRFASFTYELDWIRLLCSADYWHGCIRSRISRMRRWFEFNRRRKPISPVLLECMHKQIELYGKAQPKEDPGDHPGNGSWKIQQLDRSRAKGEPTESSAIVQAIQGYWRDSNATTLRK